MFIFRDADTPVQRLQMGITELTLNTLVTPKILSELKTMWCPEPGKPFFKFVFGKDVVVGVALGCRVEV